MLRGARQTASNRHRLIGLFLGKCPFTAICTNCNWHNANVAAITLNKHDAAFMLVKRGQERTGHSSEEAEVLSAGCQLHSHSGRTDKTIITEAMLCCSFMTTLRLWVEILVKHTSSVNKSSWITTLDFTKHGRKCPLGNK